MKDYQTKLICPDPSLLESVKDPQNAILSSFEGLNAEFSLQKAITENHYIKNCYFLRNLKKCIADYEFNMRVLPIVDSESEEF